jgi:hypothetical protein
MWKWQLKKCSDSCIKEKEENKKFCCVQQCAFRLLNLIGVMVDNNGVKENHTFPVALALAKSMLLSVENDTNRKKPLEEGTEYCEDLLPKEKDWDICRIPTVVEKIIECTYIENFYRCPNSVWNPKKLDEPCMNSWKYVCNCSRYQKDESVNPYCEKRSADESEEEEEEEYHQFFNSG